MEQVFCTPCVSHLTGSYCTRFLKQLRLFFNITHERVKLVFINLNKGIDNIPLNTDPVKWVNTLQHFVGKSRQIVLNVSDHFVGLALKGLRYEKKTDEVATVVSSLIP